MIATIDELVVTLGLSPEGFVQGAAIADEAGKKLQASAVAAAEAAHAAAQKSAQAARDAASAQQEYAKAATESDRTAAKQKLDIARADASAAALASSQRKQWAQTEAALLAKHVNDARAASEAVEKAAKAEADAAKKAAAEKAAAQKRADAERDKSAKQSEKQQKDAADQIRSLKNEVLGLFAVFEAGKGIAGFLNSTNKTEVATAALSAATDVGVEKLTTYQAAYERMGATAEDVSSSFKGLAQVQADWKLKGIQVAAESMQLAAQSANSHGDIRNVDLNGDREKALENILHNAKEIKETLGGAAAIKYAKGYGVSEGQIAASIQFTDAERARYLEQSKNVALTEKDTEAGKARTAAAAELAQTFNRLAETLLTNVSPALISVEHDIEDLLKSEQAVDFSKFLGSDEFKADVKEFEQDAVAIAGAIKSGASEINEIVKSTVGWKIAIEALIGLKLLGWVAALIGPIAKLAGLADTAGRAMGLMRAAAPVAETVASGSVAIPAAVAAGMLALGSQAAKATGETSQNTVDAVAAGSTGTIAGADQGQGEVKASAENSLKRGWNKVSSLWGAAPVHLETKEEGLESQYRTLKEQGASPEILADYEKSIQNQRAKDAAAHPGASPASSDVTDAGPAASSAPQAGATVPAHAAPPDIKPASLADRRKAAEEAAGATGYGTPDYKPGPSGPIAFEPGTDKPVQPTVDTPKAEPGTTPSGAAVPPGSTITAPTAAAPAPTDPAAETATAVPPGTTAQPQSITSILLQQLAQLVFIAAAVSRGYVPGATAALGSGPVDTMAGGAPRPRYRHGVPSARNQDAENHPLPAPDMDVNGPSLGKSASKQDKTAQLMQYFQSQGWSKEQAAGVVSNLTTESGLRTDAVGDGGHAVGLAQWHRDRSDVFKKLYGKEIKDASLLEQAAFVNYELTKGNEKAAGNRLKQAKTAGEAGAIVSSKYERPLDRAGNEVARAQLAEKIAANASAAPISPAYVAAAQPGAATQVAQAGASTVNNDKSIQSQTTVGTVNINTTTPDPAGHATAFNRQIGQYGFVNDANTSVV